ncbi:hypothetical protein ABKW28_12975 [Nocardioides sp. 31GB23]|uniref:hypothetical protein n=1 Tax=Nocardioides sp. 31GB23 TaxID=3156065 RepID=UPI0032AF6EB1
MTHQILSQAPEPQPVLVQPDPESRLAQLHAAYPEAKAAADEANARLKDITDGIKTELFNAAPEGERKIELHSDGGRPLRLVHSESWRVDTARLKKESPETYVRYAKKSESWSLKAVGSTQ